MSARTEAADDGSNSNLVDTIIANSIAAVLGISAFAVSFSHVIEVATKHGQTGWKADAISVSVELMALAAVAEIRRRKRAGEATFPAYIPLVLGVGMSLAANLATASPGAWGKVMAAWPAIAFLTVAIMVETRTKPDPSDEESVTTIRTETEVRTEEYAELEARTDGRPYGPDRTALPYTDRTEIARGADRTGLPYGDRTEELTAANRTALAYGPRTAPAELTAAAASSDPLDRAMRELWGDPTAPLALEIAEPAAEVPAGGRDQETGHSQGPEASAEVQVEQDPHGETHDAAQDQPAPVEGVVVPATAVIPSGPALFQSPPPMILRGSRDDESAAESDDPEPYDTYDTEPYDTRTADPYGDVDHHPYDDRTESAYGAPYGETYGAPYGRAAYGARTRTVRTERTEVRTERRPRKAPARSAGGGTVKRTEFVAGLAKQIQANPDWKPDYDELQAVSGFKRSWCEKAVSDARNLASAR